ARKRSKNVSTFREKLAQTVRIRKSSKGVCPLDGRSAYFAAVSGSTAGCGECTTATLSFSLAHHLLIRMQQLRWPPFPWLGRTKGTRPWNQRGEAAPCPHSRHRTGRRTDCSTVCPVKNTRP